MASAEHKSKIETLLQELKEKYAKTVKNNPDTVAQIESAVRIFSFLVAGMLFLYKKSCLIVYQFALNFSPNC